MIHVTTLSPVLYTAIIAGLVYPVLGQTQPNNFTEVPDYALYDAFFFRVTWLDSQAAKLAAEGKDGRRLVSTIRLQAQLTQQEEAVLKTVAADCRAKTDAIVSAQRGLAAAGLARDNPQMEELITQRKQAVLDHIQQLRTAMGSARFFLLDLWVRRSVVRPGAGAPVGRSPQWSPRPAK